MKKIRDSKIELMRIMCMLFLVMHHFILHGDILTNISPNTFIYNIFVIFYPIGKICYDIFIVISCYYMINTQFSGMRFINIWLEVFFYNIIIDFFVIVIEGYKGYSSILWNKLVPTYTVYLHNGIIYFMIISIILFFICIIVDMIRQKFITNNLIKLKPINSFAETLNKLLYI